MVDSPATVGWIALEDGDEFLEIDLRAVRRCRQAERSEERGTIR
jgi:hypothetical protein